jgi:hypothetical protein
MGCRRARPEQWRRNCSLTGLLRQAVWRVLIVAGVAVLSRIVVAPHGGCQGCDAAMWVANLVRLTPGDLQLPRSRLHPPSRQGSQLAGVELGVV